MAEVALAISEIAAIRSNGQMEEAKTALGSAFCSSSNYAYYAPTHVDKNKSIRYQEQPLHEHFCGFA